MSVKNMKNILQIQNLDRGLQVSMPYSIHFYTCAIVSMDLIMATILVSDNNLVELI